MSKSYSKEVLKRLQQELDATTDTKEIIRIGNAIAKLTKKQHSRRGRPKKPVAVAPSKPSILNRVTGSALDQLSPKEKVMNYLVNEYEKRCRVKGKTFSELSRAEKDAMYAEVKATLSDEDRTMLNSGSAEVA